jgi:hypothetical protein
VITRRGEVVVVITLIFAIALANWLVEYVAGHV